MNIQKAFKLADEARLSGAHGLKLRKKSWTLVDYVMIRKIYFVAAYKNHERYAEYARLTVDDLIANDWEVV